MGWTLLCLLQTFLGDHCFCNSCKQTCMFAFLCPLFYLEGECSLVLFIGQSHAERLCCCVLRAAYFTIYTSILLFRQCPTFSACFSPPPRVSAQIIPHLKWPLFEYLGAELLFRYTVFILRLEWFKCHLVVEWVEIDVKIGIHCSAVWKSQT